VFPGNISFPFFDFGVGKARRAIVSLVGKESFEDMDYVAAKIERSGPRVDSRQNAWRHISNLIFGRPSKERMNGYGHRYQRAADQKRFP